MRDEGRGKVEKFCSTGQYCTATGVYQRASGKRLVSVKWMRERQNHHEVNTQWNVF